ncbi:MAG: STAS domain-containing protein [Turneriella sp.]
MQPLEKRLQSLHLELKVIDPETLVFILNGEISLYNSQTLRKEIDKNMTQGIRNFLLDFTNVSMIDSSGIGALFAITRTLSARSGRVSIFGASSYVRKIFEMTRVVNYLSLTETLDETLAGLRLPLPARI